MSSVKRACCAAFVTCLAVLLALTARASDGQSTAIVGVTLIDGSGGLPVEDATVVVRGERVVAAGPRTDVTVPNGAWVLEGDDATFGTIAPGMAADLVLLSRDPSVEIGNSRSIERVMQAGQWLAGAFAE